MEEFQAELERKLADKEINFLIIWNSPRRISQNYFVTILTKKIDTIKKSKSRPLGQETGLYLQAQAFTNLIRLIKLSLNFLSNRWIQLINLATVYRSTKFTRLITNQMIPSVVYPRKRNLMYGKWLQPGRVDLQQVFYYLVERALDCSVVRAFGFPWLCIAISLFSVVF
jgi:hypothetical protein